ncbi:methyltransferase domain-containing protein [Acutalibacter muris]|jgi:trans-aconitate 2-methyltransferase|uniref:Methyltransferase domain-containing protein n=1 Tax=Acutalibacter muris TaxID=1796620 RepID=A0A1Z2XQT2_9FIRM|nr:methyltransferase domain-containing protein [Acutalibacter muris]ANU52572.1 trans-aconitate methyltransferase [Hungateiclostridiaceae bacterium KB18]ASB40761.1 trans-aconitate methyltransferase [Acutalibacter muris]QQR30042.1 methyltransferase domain-containing protein [Acutalibacter muris]
MSGWNAQQYLKFKKERTQPAIDLAARIEYDAPAKALDVGCGPGNSTAVLKARFPGANVTGADYSGNMVETARKDYPELEFIKCDISAELDSLPHDYDIVFSNACLQWVPDHPSLLPRLMGLLKPGGLLAVQIPMNYQEPIHKIIEATVAQSPWTELIPYMRLFYTLSQEQYFDILSEVSTDFTLWQTTYLHRMPSHQAIMDWYSSTGLRPYLDAAVSEAARDGFYQEVFSQVREQYPIQKKGEIIFRFPRFFFIAQK